MLNIGYVIATFSWMFLVFYYTRLSIAVLINHLLNTSNRKKRKKGQTFKEWFFYKRFLDVLQRKYLIWYYSNFLFCFIEIIVVIILQFFHFEKNVLGAPLRVYMIVSFVYMVIMSRPVYAKSSTIEQKKQNKK